MVRVSKEILRRQPSVVCLQEVWHQDDGAAISSAFAKQGFRRVDAGLNRDWLLGGLLCFFQSRDWTLEGAPVFHEFHGHAPKIRVWEGDGLGRKGILLFNLKSQFTGKTVAFGATHLQAQYGVGREYREVRIQQVEELNAFAGKIPRERPAIVAGDFNTAPEEYNIYSRMSAVWVDLTAEVRALTHYGTAWNDQNHHVKWIDYIWSRKTPSCTISASVQLIQNQHLDVPYSDHEGLDASLTIE